MSLKVSLLLDGEVTAGEAESTLEEAAAEPALRDRFTVYGLIGDALRGNSTPDDGYSLRILDRMRRERVRLDSEFDPLVDP
jgi:negative regulator of sigma E activity